MKKLFLLAGANIRRSKGQMAILLLIFLIAATLLNSGLAVLFGFNNHLETLIEKLNTTQVHFIISKHLFNDDVYRLLNEETTEFALHDALWFNIEFPNALDENEPADRRQTFIFDVDDERELSQWMLVGDSLPMTERGLYLSYLLYAGSGYRLGQELILELDDVSHSFIIEGFIEPIWMDHMGWGMTMIVPSARFAALNEQYTDSRVVAAYLNGVDNFRNFVMDVSQNAGIEEALAHFAAEGIFTITNLDMMRGNRTLISLLMSIMMIAFTFIIMIVSLFVVRFRIKNSIEEDMQKIGSLQSIGYTNRQIRAANCLQFGMVTFFSALFSIIPTFFLLPIIGRVFAAQSGMLWEPGFTPLINICVIVGLMSIVLLVTLLATRVIKKITPVQALRRGINTHSFKRNPIPLDKSRLPLILSLSLKSVFQGIRQSLMTFFIILAVSFAAIFALMLFYNAAINISAFEQVPGFERSNSTIRLTPGQDIEAIIEEVLSHEHVRDAQFQDSSVFLLDGTPVSAEIMEDFDRRVTQNIFDGIFPRYANEIAVSLTLAADLNLRIGDEVHVGAEDIPFIITGITHGMVAEAYLTFSGLERIFPNIEKTQLLIYLYPGTNAALFTEQMETQMGDRAFMVTDGDAGFADGVGPFASVFAMVGLAILILAALIIILILYFVLGAVIIRRHRELGIQKAIGFTTRNLMSRLSLEFSFPILLGTAAGTFLGIFLTNPLMSASMRPMGMMATYIINIPWAIIAGVIITLLAYCISMLIAWRIRKISAYRLVTE